MRAEEAAVADLAGPEEAPGACEEAAAPVAGAAEERGRPGSPGRTRWRQ